MEDLQCLFDYIRTFNIKAFSSFLNTCPQGVIFLDQHGRIDYANPAAQNIVSEDTLLGCYFHSFLSPTCKQQQIDAFEMLINEQESTTSGIKTEAKIDKGNGDELPIEISFNLIDGENNKLIFCIMSDIAERIRLQQQLYLQTITDSLTGIYNRRYFDNRLMQELKRSKRHNRSFSSIIIDIDGFKQANDLFGHSFGDKMLISATRCFQDILREDDTAYRYGGDEFAMLLPETAKEGANEVAERLKVAFAKYVSTIKQQIKLSLSIGVASYPEDGTDEKSLIGAADRRMYQSKESGGNMVTARDNTGYLKHDTERLLQSLTSLAHLMEQRRALVSTNPDYNHSQNIRTLVVMLGNEIGLSKKQLSQLEQAAMLHDIGTIYIPSEILSKNGPLTSKEWNDVKRHTLIGEEIIESIAATGETELLGIKEIVGQHHEKLDGSGYPRGLKGNDICFEAQILSVCDTYTALLADRPYRKAFSKEEALQEILRLSGVHFSPEVVKHLANIVVST